MTVTRTIPITVHLTMTGEQCGSAEKACAMFCDGGETWCQMYDQKVMWSSPKRAYARCPACLAAHPEPDPDTIVRSES